MFAVVKIGGNQYKVTPGSSITVDRLNGAQGTQLSFPALLVASENTVILGKEAEVVSVTAKIMEHFQGDKISVDRFRAKSRHRRHKGFRHQLTTVLIEKIGDTSATISQPVVAHGPKTVRKQKPKTA